MYHLTIVLSHNGQGAEIMQIAFSPRDNLLAWTDKQGSFHRWPKPISDNFPSPVKSATRNDASGVQTAGPNGAELFPDDMNLNDDLAEEEDFGADMGDIDGELDDPNFVIDDLGIGYQDEPASTKHNDDIREMG